jgi:hypothetical protein
MRSRTHTQVKIRAEQAVPGPASGCRCPRLTCRHRVPAGLSLPIPSHRRRESASRAQRLPLCCSARGPAGPRARMHACRRMDETWTAGIQTEASMGPIASPLDTARIPIVSRRLMDEASIGHQGRTVCIRRYRHTLCTVYGYIYTCAHARAQVEHCRLYPSISSPCPPLRTRAPSILTLHFASRSARPSMSALTMSTWPYTEAVQSGVHPSCRRYAEEERNTAKHSVAAVLHCVVALSNMIMHGRLRRSYIRGPSSRRRGAASSRAAEAECRVREQHHIARHSNTRMGLVPRQ